MNRAPLLRGERIPPCCARGRRPRKQLVLVAFTLAACGPKAPPAETLGTSRPPPIDANVDDVVVPTVVSIDAAPPIDAPPARAAVAPVDPMTLPELAPGKGPVEIYAVEASTDRLLVSLIDRRNYIGVVLGATKKTTGRIALSSRANAFAEVAKLAGVDPKVPTFKGAGAIVDLDFSAAPAADLFRLLGEIGHANVVISFGALPDVNIRVKKVPWDATLVELARVTGRKVAGSGPMRYLLAPSETLPPLGKVANNVVSLEANGATASELVAGLRGVTAFPIGACATDRVTFRLRRTTAPEAARAIQVATGAILERETTCGMLPPQKTPTVGDKLVVIASASQPKGLPKYVAVFASANGTGSYLVTENVTDVGIVTASSSVTTTPAVKPVTYNDFIATMRRTAALVTFDAGATWTAFVESDDGLLHAITSSRPNTWLPWNMDLVDVTPPTIDKTGVTFTLDDATQTKRFVPFGR